MLVVLATMHPPNIHPSSVPVRSLPYELLLISSGFRFRGIGDSSRWFCFFFFFFWIRSCLVYFLLQCFDFLCSIMIPGITYRMVILY